jgi:Domain of unknown function (DUF929)
MSPQKRRPQARKGRTAAAAAAKSGRNDRTSWIVAAVIVVVGVALVFAFASAASKKHNSAQDDQPASASLVSKVTGVPDSVITQVGQGTATLPTKLPGPVLKKDGKPRIVYMGAEYCPYCATERWAMVNAFSRFGTFKGLQTTTSAGSPEVFPNTATFSFYKSTYTSDYIVFEPIETQTREKKDLETPTADQSALEAKWNKPPYASGQGSIPFIDFADSFLISGASYDAGVLTDKTHDDIAAALQDPTTDIAKGAIGTANSITAAICVTTDNKPANVCNNSAVQGIATTLKAKT